ncbi:hypothetical protein SAMN04487831_102227 [Pseudobutyrivibrio sp. UC1225]|uniref:hypothetical protein n=1 Tax=Pseudobutyrivibrio sp. UC1225 TaxID=1798185 RepID=UPI0008F1573F|nr:hypothetical protein [Pseudobutyrivibrio sp. UC1225]SFN63213.1 hypothetical protein SAMN04487831_102227 [Pseudobutyrivibrio sp. UC1225]
MKKRFLIMMMTMVMGLSMVACGKSNDDFYNSNCGCGVDYDCDDDGVVETGLKAEDAHTETTIDSDVFDIHISVMDDGDTVLDRLTEEFGDPTNTEVNDNYHTDTFDDISVTYCEEDGKKELIEFKVMSDRYKTSKGITIGSTVDDVNAAYGEALCEYDEGDEHYMNYFYDDGFSIYFTCANGEVITYQIVMGRG